MVDCRGFPYTTHPTGWHQVAWSDQIGPGEKLALRYFGRDLVLYRGTGGRLHLVDGHCPHMGAHLGIGGSVVGDDIICPNHGWRFDASGRNVEIPYADRPNGTSIRAWEVRESASLVLAWYSADGRVPAWEPMSFPEFDAGERVAHRAFRHTWERVRIHPQFVIENLVDTAHFKFVHGTHEIPEMRSYEADGPNFRVHSTIVFGQGNKASWRSQPRALHTEAWGLGATVARFGSDSSIYIQTTTPIDGEFADSWATVLVPHSDLVDGDPTQAAARRFDHECTQFEHDLPIWENLTFVHPAPFPPREAKPFRDLRRWSTQFYPDAVPGHFGQHQSFTSPSRAAPADRVLTLDAPG